MAQTSQHAAQRTPLKANAITILRNFQSNLDGGWHWKALAKRNSLCFSSDSQCQNSKNFWYLHFLLFSFFFSCLSLSSHLCLFSHLYLSFTSSLSHLTSLSLIHSLSLFSMRMTVITGSVGSVCALCARVHGPWPFRCLPKSSLGITVYVYLLRTRAT